MGQLQEQSIPSLFQGISQQPSTVRFRGQLEDAENMTFAVETGGMSKRPGTELLGSAGTAKDGTGTDPVTMKAIQSGGKNYAVIHEEGRLKVHDLTRMEDERFGNEIDVEFEVPEDEDLKNRKPGELVFLNVLDTTFVVDRTQTVEMDDRFEVDDGATYGAAQLTNSGVEDTFSISIVTEDGSRHTKSTTVSDVSEGTRDIINDLENASWDDNGVIPERMDVYFEGSFVYVVDHEGKDFSIETEDPFGSSAWRSAVSRVDTTEKLPAKTWDGHRIEIRTSTESEGYWLKFTTNSDDERGSGFWDETIPDGTLTRFDTSTMPRILVPTEDGKFRLERVDWTDKKAGGDELVPPPDFVGKRIEDIVFFANRLGFLAGETVFFSGSGDYFRFWPDSGVSLNDDDPFGLTNTTASASVFAFGTNFRRSLYITADNAQFEVFGQPFTPSTAAIEIATRYPTDNQVRPLAVGDELYFVSGFNNRVALYAYTYTEDTASETALEVSKHVDRLITGAVTKMESNPLTNEIFILTDDDPSLVYVHRWYYDGRERAQSSWTKFRFEDRSVKDMAYLDGAVVFLTSRPVVLDGEAQQILDFEVYRTRDSGDEKFSIYPNLDRHWIGMEASYDEDEDKTIFAPTGDDREKGSDLTAVVPEDGPEDYRGLEIDLYQTDDGFWAVDGDWIGTSLLFGQKFEAMAELSTQYVRTNQDEPIISGRLQLRRMEVWYDDTGYFRVRIKPHQREDRVHEFNNRILGSGQNQIQNHNIGSGVFQFLVGSRSDSTRIIFESDSFLPFTLTSVSWIGFFNETSRQG